MDVVSLSPLRVAALFWRPQAGTHALTVVCKATFTLAAGTARLARQQDEPAEEDRYHEGDPRSSLYQASDLAPFKSRADVTLVGDAFAPGGVPARLVVARLIVGTVDKSIEVHCDRHFDAQSRLVEGEPFSRMALRYERAARDGDGANPVGVDPAGGADRFGRRVLPNLQPVGASPRTPGNPLAPVGFGPIAPGWAARRALLGRYGSSWSDEDWFMHPLPTDLDGAFFNAAPRDQQLSELRESERIVLRGLHPSAEQLVCDLPGLKPRGFVERGSDVRELAMRSDTLWIDTVRGVCSLTWRGRVELQRPDEQGRVLIAKQEPGEHLTWAEVARLPEGGPVIVDEQTADVVLPTSSGYDEHTAVGPVGGLGGRALPFQKPAEQVPPPPLRAPPSARGGAGGLTSAMQLIEVDDRAPLWMQSDAAKRPGAQGASGAAPPISASAVPAPAAPGPAAPGRTSAAAAASAASPWARGADPAGGTDTSKTTPEPPKTPGPDAQASEHPPRPAAAGIHPGGGGGDAYPAGAAPAVRPPNPVAALRQQPATSPARVEPAAEARAGRVGIAAPPEVVELLWYEEGAMEKLRTQPPHAALIAELEKRAEPTGPIDFDEEPPPEEPPPVRDRRAVVAVMTQGTLTTAAGLRQAMLESVDEAGSFEAPLVLLSGKLELPFDELETLKATVAAVAPMTAGNKELQDTVDAVGELLQTPWLQSSGEVANNLTDRVRAAFKRADRMIDAGYLDSHTERTLLTHRCYQKRNVFGQQWIRALMTPSAARNALPCYLPEALAGELPMFKSFGARIIAEAHAQQDQYESHDCALEVVALGRVVSFRGTGRR